MAMKIRKRCYDCKTTIAELGFVYPRLNHAGTSVEDGCDGFCPECAQMLKCEVYQKELKNEWEWIYS